MERNSIRHQGISPQSHSVSESQAKKEIINSNSILHLNFRTKSSKNIVVHHPVNHREAVTHLQFPLLPESEHTFTVQMKNWLPFVLGPAFAILITPGPVCFTKAHITKSDS